MTLQASGVIDFSDIQTEFGGTDPIGISEYYRGGGRVPNHPNNTNIPTSGAIKISNFYDTSNAYRVSVTISSSNTNVSLASLLNPTTYSVPYIVELTINAGVEITSTSTSTPALDIGTGWNAGTIINIRNYGTIAGKGGAGGNGGAAYQSIYYSDPGASGASGGPGLQIPNPASTTVNLYNYSTGIIGGGGGGGGGGGSGVNPGVAYYGAGGGGGGGAGGGSGGTGGITSGSYGSVQVGSNGSAGTTTAGGAGGAGYAGLGSGGAGGSGGGLGQNGNEGTSGCGSLAASASGGVGAGGYSIVGYAWLSVVSNIGTISGSTTSYPASLPSAIARSDAYNYPSCSYAKSTVPYWNGGNNPDYVPPGDGGGGDGGDD